MKLEGQTAIRGVASVGATNLAVRLIGYAKHVIIAAYIGLSAHLDAFYMAFAVMSLVVFSFGDVFDSLGVPRLVDALRREGEDSFKKAAGGFLAFSFLLSIALGATLLLVAPWASAIAPGFTVEKREFIYRSLLYLSPVVLFYLPHHAIGSFLRVKRRFLSFYLGELIFAVVSLAVVYLWRDFPYVVPLSVTLATFAAFLYVCFVGKGCFRMGDIRYGEELRAITIQFFRILPLYLISYMYVLVDRTFASFLPTGGVSALSYGMLIVMIPPSILMIENIFITPLAESPERGELMNRIINGAIITSVPLAVFTVMNAEIIVQAGLERGVFTSASTEMTADALAFFGLALPAFFILPISFRLFQILGKLVSISVVGLLCVISNAFLNYFFLNMGMGIKGLALATSLSNYLSVAGAAVLLARLGIRAFTKRTLWVFLVSLAASVAAMGIAGLVPGPSGSLGGLILRGSAFLIAAAGLYRVIPNSELKEWRNTVIREILPSRTGTPC
ncbi:MAG TPA: lipid II flippase MurJ [Nitrospiraceae bacterium]|jgi:putative peptidoglycan lipid II flippase